MNFTVRSGNRDNIKDRVKSRDATQKRANLKERQADSRKKPSSDTAADPPTEPVCSLIGSINSAETNQFQH